MFGPSQFGTYTRIPLRSSIAYVNLRKPRGGHCGIQDIDCLLLIEGAKVLGNVGFEPQGENLSLIMVETGKGTNTGRYIIETRMDDLIKELNIDKDRITGVSHKSTAWNIKMMATTALLHCTIYLFKSGYQQLEHKYEIDMDFPGFACYWRFHHCHTHPTTHTKTNNHSFRPIPCQTRPTT